MPLVNFRDIGGAKLLNGKAVKKKILFRMGNVSFLERNEFEFFLRRTNVNCYIDFRNDLEMQNVDLTNYFFSKIENFHQLKFDMEDRVFSNIFLPNCNDWAEFYERIFKKNLSQIIIFLEILLRDSNKSIVFGCNAGKDRTGIMTVVLFSLLGVSRDEIVKDYCLSNQGLANYHDFFEDCKKELGRTREQFIKNFLVVSSDVLNLFLNKINLDCGGILTCLLSSGLSLSMIDRLKSKFVE
jgi:protein-tyrosine phosphatase